MEAESESLRVLVVDDEPFTLKALNRILRRHEVTLASSGAEALQCIATEPPFAVIVCDVMMPEMNGVQFYEQLAARHPGLEAQVVFVTGGALGSQVVESVERLPNPLLPKPFDREQLLDTIARMGANARSGDD